MESKVFTRGRLRNSLDLNRVSYDQVGHSRNAAVDSGIQCRYPLRGRVDVGTALKIAKVLKPSSWTGEIVLEIMTSRGMMFVGVLHGLLVLRVYYGLSFQCDRCNTQAPSSPKWQLGTHQFPLGLLGLLGLDRSHWSCDSDYRQVFDLCSWECTRYSTRVYLYSVRSTSIVCNV